MFINEKDFKPLTKKPESGNPYFNRKPEGYSPCIQGNPLDKGLNVLANCVGWAIGRFNFETQEGSCKYMGTMNAENFYANAYKWGLETGQTPKVGAIICWSKGKPAYATDGAGHVAIVEQINADGSLLISESGYKSYIFRNRTINNKNGNWGAGSSYHFQGFIYNPHIVKVTDPVPRNEEVNQLKILKDTLRVRAGAGLDADILQLAKVGIYNDLESVDADGYTWHKIAENNWVADVKDYVELLPKVEFKVGDIVTIKQPIVKYKIVEIEDNIASIIPISDLENLKKD